MFISSHRDGIELPEGCFGVVTTRGESETKRIRTARQFRDLVKSLNQVAMSRRVQLTELFIWITPHLSLRSFQDVFTLLSLPVRHC